MNAKGKRRTYNCKHCLQRFSSEEKLRCHMNRGCYNIVGTVRVLPKDDETWIQYEDDKMMYKEKYYVLLYAMQIFNVFV